MTWLDDHGRLFGRVNIIDAFVLVVVCALIPLTYSAYLLFRAETPVLLRIEPSTIVAGAPHSVPIVGEALRPYLRIHVGPTQVPFLFERPDRGRMDVPALPAGVYDVVLYDVAQELNRLRDGLIVVEPPPVPPVPLVGARFVIEGEEELYVARERVVFTVVRDRVTNTCAQYRRDSADSIQNIGVTPCR